MLVVMFSHFLGKLLQIGSLVNGALVRVPALHLPQMLLNGVKEHRVLMFPRGSAELLCTAPVYPSGVCLPLHFAMFISVAAPVHALSSCW